MNDQVETPSDVSAEASIDSDGLPGPPPAKRLASEASYDSHQRHRRRNPRTRRPVKETLDARSEYRTSQDDGTAEHRINQYVIKQEIGRGSFGAVHLAADQFGNEFAVKEFSKARLRKRAQSHLLRRPRGPRRPGTEFNSPLHRNPAGENENAKNPLYLIKEEIAIMKKLNHNNLVSLIEVLDDPTEDSLYMVMEMCKKGVVMKVGLEDRADPYDDEQCRCWLRDLILGIEYLHAQGIVHRDIKPDNCLVTNDDVLKVVDFGVSEMFEKNSDMFTAKSAGSPAFLPPELCVVKHGDVSGKAADIWSMGVTLYCLRYGKLPFEKQSIFELYESIRNDPVMCEDETDEGFKHMIGRILEKDPTKRIKMRELRVHPWVTKNGADPLLPWEENTAQIVEPPTEEEMNSAITRNMNHLITVMKAVKRFKRLIGPAKSAPPMQSILGEGHEAHFVEPPMEMDPDEEFPRVGADLHPPTNQARAGMGRHPMLAGIMDRRGDSGVTGSSDSTNFSSRYEHSPASSQWPSGVFEPERKDSGSIHSEKSQGKPDVLGETSQSASPRHPLSRASSAATKRSAEGTRGHARDPLKEEYPYLFIGPSTYSGPSTQQSNNPNMTDDSGPIFEEPESTLDRADPMDLQSDEPMHPVSESPGAAEFDIYETAYRQELERIKASLTDRDTGPKVYLTRRVEGKDDVMKLAKDKSLDLQIGRMKDLQPSQSAPSAFSAAASLLRNQIQQQRQSAERAQESSPAASHPPSSSLSSQSLPHPEASSLEATGVPATDSQPGTDDSSAQLRRLLGRVRDKQGDA